MGTEQRTRAADLGARYPRGMDPPRARRAWWKLAGAAALAALVLAPGWSARLVPADHGALLAAAGRSRSQLGVTRPGEAPGEEWHLQYLDSWPVRVLDEMALRRLAPLLVPPDFAAHVPAGSGRADGYFRGESRLRWPWWWPGGGVDWTPASLR